MSRLHPSPIPLSAAAIIAVLGLLGCGKKKPHSTPRSVTAPTSTSPPTLPGTGKPSVTIGDKNFTEQFVLGELYAQAMRAKGYSVNIKNDIGAHAVLEQ